MAILAFNFKFLVVARIRMELELEVSSQIFLESLFFLLHLVSFTVDIDPL